MDEAEDFLFESDICCANLETPVVPSVAASFVLMYKEGKVINFFSTANNHCLDMGEEGLIETLEFLDKKGCQHVGTANSDQQRDEISIIEKNGIRIAFLSYTFSINGKSVPQGKNYLTNYVRLNKPDCDISLIEKQIYIAKTQKKADMIIACIHWSLEFEAYPIQNVIDMGHRLMALGIDVIIGNHPHGVQPMEKYAFHDPFLGLQKQGLIIYALGDLISCHEHIPNSRLNNMLRLIISKGKINGRELTIISDVKIRPMYIYSKIEGDKCVDFRLLNFNKLIEEINKNNNYMDFDEEEVKELKRIDVLMHKLLHIEIM